MLTQVSRPTKGTLNRLGVFTVSSLHAYICARSPSLLNNLLAGRGATKRRAPMLARSNSTSGIQIFLEWHHNYFYRHRASFFTRFWDEYWIGQTRAGHSTRSSGTTIAILSILQFLFPQVVTVFLRDAMTVEEFLAAGCIKKGLSPVEHFIRVKKRRDMPTMNYFVPHRSDLIETYLSTHEVVEVCGKILYQVELARNTLNTMWGFSVEAELVENSEKQVKNISISWKIFSSVTVWGHNWWQLSQENTLTSNILSHCNNYLIATCLSNWHPRVMFQDELCCYVSRVEDRSVAMENGESLCPRTSSSGHFSIRNKIGSKLVLNYRHYKGWWDYGD